ncbi:MAG: hypothetical protein ABTR92_02395 [Candidatus Accumulibacter phosphatis]|uniref:hypothetical protein n=1 Tax=Candidatus Accumulibacter sp. ACC012 TaxID=2823332 RepID=UPI0025BDDBDB|nr:hypothetical protein [Candidatus Accumulibacter sp. ACC012]
MSTLVGQGLTDIDALALAVRDRESRRLIAEAITAYRGGALRSSIMSTWIAVSFDIIAKARELAAQGEAAPKAFVQDLDSAIANSDIRKMQTTESDLLKTADEQLQLFAPHELDALRRLQNDRNLCAHPAFIVEDELYQPTLELVRSHIVHALQYLLIHAPLQGKSAITRFDADIVSPSFPTICADIGTYIRAKYLDRAKDVLVTNLIKALLSAPFGDERARFVGRSRLLAMTLREVAKAKTSIYDATVPSYVAKKFDSVQDDVLLTICPFLENDVRIWEWLSEPVRLRIKQLLQTAEVETLKAHAAFDAFAVAELGDVLLARLDAFDRNTQISIIGEHPKREFVHRGIQIYSDAGGYRTAEAWGQSIILPLAPHFNADDIRSLLETVQDNGRIWDAGGTPDILNTVFDITRHLLPQSRQYWQTFVDGRIAHNRGNTEDHYSYPGLQQRLAA